VLATTVRTEGVRGLYKGVGPTLLSAPPFVALQMTTFSLLSSQLTGGSTGEQRHTGSSNPVVAVACNMAAGAGAALTAQTLTFPMDTVRKRLMLDGQRGGGQMYTSATHCITRTVAQEGGAALVRGLSAIVLRCVPAGAVQFTVFDMVRRSLLEEGEGL
jgi:solute carrier family 25 phosphate transporter 23/24/25/41